MNEPKDDCIDESCPVRQLPRGQLEDKLTKQIFRMLAIIILAVIIGGMALVYLIQ